MKQERKQFIRTALFWTAALLGLFAAQTAFMLRTYRLESAAFRQNAQNALGSLVQKLENRETVETMFSLVLRMGGDTSAVFINGTLQDSVTLSITPSSGQSPIPGDTITPRNLSLQMRRNHAPRLDTLASESLRIMTFFDTSRTSLDTIRGGSLGRYTRSFPDSLMLRGFRTERPWLTLGQRPAIYWNALSDSLLPSGRRLMVEKVLSDLELGESRPIQDRLDAVTLDSLIQATLKENGIKGRADYGIHHGDSDSLSLCSAGADTSALRRSTYRTRLFPHDVLVGHDDLVLTFPRESLLILGHMGLFGTLVILFLLLIIVVSASFFRKALAQQHFSRTLMDFINNMTHEFKTPISTLALIGENLSFSGVPMEASRLNRYGQILRDESRRMRGQVEKILQMASLEQGDIELKIEDVDIHALVGQTVENLTPRVQRLQGRFRTRLDADPAEIPGDAQHLSNVLYNLLDNAMKYASQTPDILIETATEDGFLRLTVKDNGVGLAPEDAARIFDKYYRVPTGNVHNVKGFGLGLAYVKLMAQAHGGRVGVESQKGTGSTFSVWLPLEGRP